MVSKYIKLILAFGPGIFAIGYTIGTGSVTSMIVAGNTYGMQLLWVLFLSCLFSWVMMEAYGRYCLVTGQTALYGMRKNLRFGNIIAILIIVGVTFGQWNSLIGILGITSNLILETVALYIPAIKGYEYIAILCTAVLIISTFYFILWHRNYSFFEKVLLFFVSAMGMSFLLSNFIVLPDPKQVIGGLAPTVPDVEGSGMLIAAFVGTTMASATFLSRPLFLKGKGWDINNLKDQRRDAIISAITIFVISGSIMTVAATTLHGKGIKIEKVLDMMHALEPIAGKWAVSIFFLGTLAAGLSSIFPILIIAPIMVADYQQGTLDTKSKRFRILAAVACVVGLTVPIFGLNPIKSQIATQVFNVFILPLVIVSMIVLINKKSLMKEYKAGIVLNALMFIALAFALIISWKGVMSLIDL